MKRRISGIILKFVSSISLGILFLFALNSPAYCQPGTPVVLSEYELNDKSLYDAWVEFTDKDVRSETQRRDILANLEKNFNPRALARRKKKRTVTGLFDERDFPLASKYLSGVAETGAEIRVKSRWLNGISILARREQILKVKKLPYVKEVVDLHKHKPRITFFDKVIRFFEYVFGTFKNRTKSKTIPDEELNAENYSIIYGRSQHQVCQLGLDRLHKAGFTGSGIIVAVIDCGFDLSHKAYRHPDHPLNVIAQWDFVENDDDVTPRYGLNCEHINHGTIVLGTLASYAPGELIGTAYDADIILCNAEDGLEEYYLEERWFVAALEFAESHGADIVSSSLVLYGGYSQEKLDEKTSVMTVGMNIATGNGVVCLEGVGNSGHDQDPTTLHLMAPADAVDVIAVGSVDHQGNIAERSSDGPTKDGRLKPEVLALGREVSTIGVFNSGYTTMGGASSATPLMAGAVACILQVHPEWTVQELRNALFHSGDFFRKHGKPDPLFVHGYGIPDVYSAAGF